MGSSPVSTGREPDGISSNKTRMLHSPHHWNNRQHGDTSDAQAYRKRTGGEPQGDRELGGPRNKKEVEKKVEGKEEARLK